jgi:hypothetical protein
VSTLAETLAFPCEQSRRQFKAQDAAGRGSKQEQLAPCVMKANFWKKPKSIQRPHSKSLEESVSRRRDRTENRTEVERKGTEIIKTKTKETVETEGIG